jgi:exopolysaccharide biosynthesis protein
MFLLVLAVALGVIVVAAFAVRAPLERALVLWTARQATGLVVDADDVDPIGDGYELHGLRAYTLGGATSVDAPRAVVELRGHDARIELDSPRFVYDPDRYRGDEMQRTRDALARFGAADASLALHVRAGSLTIVSGAVPAPLLVFDALTGTLAQSALPLDYDLTLQLVDGDTRYPITAHSIVHVDGSFGNAWNAALLPLGPLVPLLPADGVRVLGGRLRDVAIDAGAALHATAQLDDVGVALGPHQLAHLHGPLEFDGDGAGTRGIAGILDTVPFEGSGEVHDLPPQYAWLREGSTDLRSLARLTEAVASEPDLRSAHVEATAPGLAFAQYALATDHGPLAVSVIAADPQEPTLRFDTVIAEDHVISGGERTSAMGLRTGAVAGVNGDYFDIGRTYQPQGLLVRTGELLRGPADRAALAIDKAKHVTIAEFRLVGTLRIAGRALPVTQLNDWPAGAGDVTVITPAFGRTLPAAAGTRFASLDPYGTDGKHFRVIDVASVDAPIPVVFGVAFGPKVDAPVRAGDIIELSYRTEPRLDTAVAAIGGGPILLRKGAWYEDPHAPAPDERNYRWPVIALARASDGHLLLVAVDGRHPERSVGMMRPEFADLLLRLGAVDAMALDSGGSVTLVSRATGDANVSVRNVPSDNSAERWVSDALFLYSSARSPTIVTPAAAPTPVPEARPTP